MKTLLTARLIVGGLGAGVLGGVLLAALVDVSAGVGALTAPAALLGLTSPVIGYRLYVSTRERVPAGEKPEARCGRYLRATILALSVTEGVALLGVVAFMVGGGPFALVGVLTHLLLTGALWPGEEKLARFLESEGSGPAPR